MISVPSDTKKGNVLIAIPCLSRGGTEMQTLLLSRVLAEAGYAVTVCCYFEYDKQVVGEFEAAGLTVTRLGWARSTGSARFVRCLRAEFQKKTPAVIHIQYMTPGFLPVVAARLAGTRRVFATVHQPATPYGWKARLLLRLAARMCDRFICVSEAAARSWFGDAACPVVIHNAVDIARIDAIPAVRIGETSVPVIGAVSRIRREKGIDVLLDAFSRITSAGARLRIVGDGPDRTALEKRGVLNVEWAGQQPWEQAVALMKGMDIVVVPSRFEGFGLTAAEAMATGKPVIASDVDGLREVVGDAGVLVPAGDAAALAAALGRLLANAQERALLGRKARERAERMFSLDLFRQRILDCYR